MALRLAAVVSQAPGFSGMPSLCQRSSALTSASWRASSARSKSSNRLISAARTRPCSSRKILSICSAAVIRSPTSGSRGPQRPDLDRSVFRGGDLFGPANCFVEILAIYKEISAQLLVCLRKRAVGDHGFVVPDADCRCAGAGGDTAAGNQYTRCHQLFSELGPYLRCRLEFFLRPL